MGIASMILGIIGLFSWILPLFGFPITITGIVLGGVGMKQGSPYRGMAIAGLVMCSIGLILNVLIVILAIVLPIAL